MRKRILLMFSLVSIVPVILVAAFSILFFHQGIQAWFNEKVGTALNESVAVAEGYLAEHRRNIEADALAVATELDRYSGELKHNPKDMKRLLQTLASLRQLTEARLIRSPIPEKEAKLKLPNETIVLDDDAMELATKGRVAVITSQNDDKVRALVQLPAFKPDKGDEYMFLLVGRPVDPEVLKHMETTRGSVDEYVRLKAGVTDFQRQFLLVFVAVAALLLVGSLWVGVVFSRKLVEPITTLVAATERIKAGDLSAHVEEGTRDDEMETLNRAFNRMTEQIAELVAAQRAAAWSDVARRIAHEIKNPLTPIHLAVERLKRKYTGQITEDAENYTKYLDTIERHIGTIGRIVEEFVQFARMPTPELRQENIAALVRDAVFSEQLAGKEQGIRYPLTAPETPVLVKADKNLISQLFTNLLKNAREALEGREGGEIAVTVTEEKGMVKIMVEDNGPGFPPELLDRITEPYVTTREKGTGLGLAIVKKIVTDHGGKLLVMNRTDGIRGGRVVVSFPAL